VPGVLAVGKAGAVNAAILATQIVANRHEEYRAPIKVHREGQAAKVLAESDPSKT
jgi:5-(carboxyamino)imidazole ribonucleotide mutase